MAFTYKIYDKRFKPPTMWSVKDAKARDETPADVKEYPNSYVRDIKVQVEDDNMLVKSGKSKREEEKEGVNNSRMEQDWEVDVQVCSP